MATLVRYVDLATRGRLRRVSADSLVRHGLLLLIAFLVFLPLFMILFGSFRDGSPFVARHFTLKGYTETFSDTSILKAMWTTIWLAVVRTALAAGLAIFLAWVIHRTDTPGRFWLDKLIYARFFLPLLPMLMAWIFLLSPRSGLINKFGTGVLGLEGPIFNINSYQGIIFTSVLGWAAFLYIFISPAFQRMDMSLEESSRMSGAGQFTTLRRVTVPLLMPAILAVTLMAFIRMIESFETELFLGSRVGIWVFTTKIFFLINGEPPDFPAAMALAMVLVLITFSLVVVQWKLLGRREYVTVTGRGYKPTPMALGRLRWVTFSLVVLYLLIDFILPLGALIFGTFMKISGVFSAGYTLSNWSRAFSEPLFLRSLRNTVVMSGAAATAAVLMAALAAYVILRTKYMGRRALELLTWVPWAVPGLVMALGVFWGYMTLPFTVALYGTIWLMVIVRVTMSLPVTTRIISSSVIQIHKELEESSRTLGAGWSRTFTRIWVPLIMPALMAAWILAFTVSVRDLNSVIFIYGPKSQVLSTVIFNYWASGYLEIGFVYGVIQALLVAFFFGILVLISRRLGRVA